MRFEALQDDAEFNRTNTFSSRNLSGKLASVRQTLRASMYQKKKTSDLRQAHVAKLYYGKRQELPPTAISELEHSDRWSEYA